MPTAGFRIKGNIMTSADILVSAIVWVSLAMSGVLLLSAADPTRKPIAIGIRRQRRR